MGTTGTRRLQRQSLSSERAQRTIKAIEAQLGYAIGRDSCDYPPSETESSEQRLGNNNEGSVDEANGQ